MPILMTFFICLPVNPRHFPVRTALGEGGHLVEDLVDLWDYVLAFLV